MTPAIRRCLAIALVASASHAAAAAAAAPPATPLALHATGSSPVSRLYAAAGDAVAWEDTYGRAIVRRDDGRQAQVPVPAAGCTRDPSWSYGLVAAGGGRLLFSCPPAQPPIRYAFVVTRLDGAGGVRRDLPTSSDSGGDASQTAVAVGARWIAQRFTGYHDVLRRYVDWRTGEERLASGWESLPADEATTVEDLDAANPRRALCRFMPAAELQPYGLPPLQAAWPFVAELLPEERGLVLRRCGERRPVLTVRKGFRPLRVALTSEWLAYVRHLAGAGKQRIVVVRLRDLRRYVVTAPAISAGLVLTRSHLYVASVDPEDAAAPRTLRVARLPRPRRSSVATAAPAARG